MKDAIKRLYTLLDIWEALELVLVSPVLNTILVNSGKMKFLSEVSMAQVYV